MFEQKWSKTKPQKGVLLNKGHPLAKGLVAAWLMNEGGGSRIYDLSGNKNTGTFYGDTKFVAGKFGSCLSFDGAGDYVDAGNSALLKPKSITVCLWTKATSSNSTPASCLASTDSTPPFSWDFYIGTGASEGKARIEIDTTGSAVTSAYGTTNILNAWHHLCITYDNSTGKGILYVDSINETSVSVSGDLDYHATAKIYIGARQDTSTLMFKGTLDNVMIFNRALSASEIAQLYREPFCMFDKARVWGVAEEDLSVNVSDQLNITEDITVSVEEPPAEDLDVNVSDNISITEDVSVFLQSPATPEINISDQLNITEDTSVTILPADLTISVSDQLNLTENTNVSIEAVVDRNIDISDQLNITESVSTEIQATTTPEISVSDQLNLTEDISIVVLPADLETSTYDELNLTESVSVEVQATTTPEINVYDQVSITENTDVSIQITTTPEISVSDQLNLTEDVSVSVQEATALDISIFDQINITENIDVSVPVADLSIGLLVKNLKTVKIWTE